MDLRCCWTITNFHYATTIQGSRGKLDTVMHNDRTDLSVLGKCRHRLDGQLRPLLRLADDEDEVLSRSLDHVERWPDRIEVIWCRTNRDDNQVSQRDHVGDERVSRWRGIDDDHLH